MVGKTCLVLRYTMGDNGEFEEYIPTIADEYTAEVTVKNTQVVFNLWDTAGITSHPDPMMIYSRSRGIQKPEKGILSCYRCLSCLFCCGQ